MARYLIVANQTLCGDQLAARLQKLMAEGPCTFHVVVPATYAKDHAVHIDGAAHATAEKRLEAALERFQALGADITGEVGDASPMLAVRDCFVASNTYDAVIVSTLAPGASRWLKQDLPHRLERNYGLPVIQVTGEFEPVG
jgi:hypothetical protein